ncbi:MAG TPA: response regulator [Croceibacterium sp.]|nr:response regulator [Croceibacterium sp.]
MSQNQVVAIVDDDRSVREALADLLQVEGYPTRLYEHGAALLADAGFDEIGCVITDVRMPGLNGLDLQRRLRARKPSLPVIFLTSSEDEGLRARALADGALAWFTKPVSDDELLESLRRPLHGSAPATPMER